MPRQDYVPRDESNLAQWAENLATQADVGANSMAMGWGSAGNVVATAATAISGAVQAKEAARQAYLATVAAQDTIIADSLGVIRPMVARGKKEPTATEAIQQTLGVWGAEIDFDPQTYKAVIRGVQSVGNGTLQIKFAKALGELDAVNLYSRKVGATAWTMFCTMLHSPYLCHVNLTTPGQPENLEIRARGVVGNDEVGLFSDTVSVMVG